MQTVHSWSDPAGTDKSLERTAIDIITILIEAAGLVETGTVSDFSAQVWPLSAFLADFVEERFENGVRTAVVDVFESW